MCKYRNCLPACVPAYLPVMVGEDFDVRFDIYLVVRRVYFIGDFRHHTGQQAPKDKRIINRSILFHLKYLAFHETNLQHGGSGGLGQGGGGCGAFRLVGGTSGRYFFAIALFYDYVRISDKMWLRLLDKKGAPVTRHTGNMCLRLSENMFLRSSENMSLRSSENMFLRSSGNYILFSSQSRIRRYAQKCHNS